MNELIIASDTRLREYGKAVVQGLELSSGARSTSTYYHSKAEQIAAVRKKVDELYQVDKSIPLLLASMTDSTYFFRQEVLRKELSSGYANGPQSLVAPSEWLDGNMQEAMINSIIQEMPFTYVLRFFVSLKDARINNRRTQSKMINWTVANINDFSVVKYRGKMRTILKHALGVKGFDSIVRNVRLYLSGDLHDANMLERKLFKYSSLSNEVLAKLILHIAHKGRPEMYRSMKFTKAFYEACDPSSTDEFFEAAAVLDHTVALGVISTGRKAIFSDMRDSDGKVLDTVKAKLLAKSKVITDDQKIRTKRLQERVGGKSRKDIDYSKVQTESLYKTKGVATQKKQRAKEDRISLPYTRIGVIQDVSLSNQGGKDSANTPAVIIEHTVAVLKESAANVTVAQTPKNQTDLSAPFIEIIDQDADVEAIFVLSDGYENFPYEGCFNDLVGRFNKRGNVQVIHCSPYVSAEMKAQARTIGSNVTSMAINKPSQIQTQMETRLLDFNPRAYFANQFAKYIGKSRVIEPIEEEIIL